MADEVPDGMTALYDADVPRVDLVGKGANGVEGFLLMKSDGTGLLEPRDVRRLIGKTEPAKGKGKVTVSGSPAAIAAMIHKASLRADTVEKAEASTASMNDRPDSDFAYIEPGGTKDESGKTVPRSLRHFPIYDAAHVRNALSRAPQSPFGDKAMPKIRAAAKKFGIDVAKDMGTMELDDLDLTEVLADPMVDAPGNPTTPGSPAWEAIDAATACKWTAVLARARAALDVMAEREMLEAASGDGEDAEAAWDLQDACCAIDYAISVLAPFAVGEHAEAEMGAEMLAAVGKAVADAPAALEVIEGLAPVRKAGRVLSSANEAAIRGAVEQLQKVLASLPAAPAVEDAMTKTANEEPDMPQPTVSEDATAASGQQPAMGSAAPEPKPVAGTAVTDVTKADGEKTPMVVVYDQKGKLIGIVDPADVTPVANSEADPEDMPGPDDGAAEQPAPEDSDLTPAPAAEAGTPAAVTAADDSVAKTDADMLKSIAHLEAEAALTAYKTAHEQEAAARAAEHDALVKEVEELKALVKALEEQPAAPKVFTNGVTPPRDLRGMDRGAEAAPVDVTKAMEMRTAFRNADPAEQNRIARKMQEAAIDRLAALHGRQ